MAPRELDVLVGAAFFLVGALAVVLVKVWTAAALEPAVVFVYGPAEPERSAHEARRRKLEEEPPALEAV
jgi:hypothetical protein